MPSEFPGSPKLLKGALVAYQIPELLPTIVVFQYNPKELTRSLQGRTPSGGGRRDVQRTDGPPSETISLTVEIDATDQLENPSQNAVTVSSGLHPALAALEGLLYPAYPTVVANQILSATGSAAILSEPAPLTLFIWGASRILPVQVQSVTIREKEYDPNLNPIMAEVDLGLKVLTYRDLGFTDPGFWVYMASFRQKEVMAALNRTQASTGTKGLLPI